MSPRSNWPASSKSGVADLLLADEQLDLAGPVLDVDEPQLARIALQHDPARGADLRPRQFARAVLGQPLPEVDLLAAVQVRQLDHRPSAVCSLISPARARISPISVRSSNRPPQGSRPSSAIRRSFSRREASWTPRLSGRAGSEGLFGHGAQQQRSGYRVLRTATVRLQPVQHRRAGPRNRDILVKAGRGSMSARTGLDRRVLAQRWQHAVSNGKPKTSAASLGTVQSRCCRRLDVARKSDQSLTANLRKLYDRPVIAACHGHFGAAQTWNQGIFAARSSTTQRWASTSVIMDRPALGVIY